MADNLTSYLFSKLEERVKVLEEQILKRSKRKPTTRAQQILLLKHLGLLDSILDLDITKDKKAQLLSIILNADYDNIHDDITHIHEKETGITTKANYEFLLKVFEDIKLKEKKEEIERKLDDLRKGEK